MALMLFVGVLLLVLLLLLPRFLVLFSVAQQPIMPPLVVMLSSRILPDAIIQLLESKLFPAISHLPTILQWGLASCPITMVARPQLLLAVAPCSTPLLGVQAPLLDLVLYTATPSDNITLPLGARPSLLTYPGVITQPLGTQRDVISNPGIITLL
jgi:hypothetical protein